MLGSAIPYYPRENGEKGFTQKWMRLRRYSEWGI